MFDHAVCIALPLFITNMYCRWNIFDLTNFCISAKKQNFIARVLSK